MYVSLKENPLLGWPLVLLLIAALYLFGHLAISLLPNPSLGAYVVPALLWLLIGAVVFYLPKYRTAIKASVKRNLIVLALMIGFVQVILYTIGGLFAGFGKSPYSFTATGIMTNLFFVWGVLVGMEMSRAWLVNRLGKNHPFLAVALVTLLFTLVAMPLNQVIDISISLESTPFLNSEFFPLLSENLLATVLAFMAGPLASIAYRGIMLSFWWFSPVLPDLPWAIAGLVGVAVPIVGLFVVRGYYQSRVQRGRSRHQEEGSLLVWIVLAVFSVAISWFSVGLFPVYPTLVASGSMEPTISKGDILIVSKVQPGTVRLGDVIQFRTLGEFTIIHRVIEIEESGSANLFITKGDANDNPDPEPVIPANVIGKAVFTIPKIGWAAIWVKGLFLG